MVASINQLIRTDNLEDQPDAVVGKDGRTRPATQPDRSAEAVARRRELIAEMSRAGLSVAEIADNVGVTTTTVYNALRAIADEPPADPAGKSASAVEARYARVAELAGQGWTSAQIATAVGMGEAGLRNGCRQRGIDIPADAVVGRAHRHDSNQIVRETVHTLEGAALGIRLVRVADLDRDQIQDWTNSLTDSIRALNRLNKQMKEMVQ